MFAKKSRKERKAWIIALRLGNTRVLCRLHGLQRVKDYVKGGNLSLVCGCIRTVKTL